MSDMEVPDLSPIGISGAAGAGVLGVYFLVGPSLKAIGNAFGDWTDYRVRNLLNIGRKAEQRLTTEDKANPKPLHPRYAKQLIDDASWIDDDLQQEYLAALLVAARRSRKSEEAAYYSRIMGNLTPSQIRLHYSIYRAFRGTFDDTANLSFTRNRDCRQMFVSAPLSSFRSVVMGDDDRADGATRGIGMATGGLQREGLIIEMGFTDTNRSLYGLMPTLLGATILHHAFEYPSGMDSIRGQVQPFGRRSLRLTFPIQRARSYCAMRWSGQGFPNVAVKTMRMTTFWRTNAASHSHLQRGVAVAKETPAVIAAELTLHRQAVSSATRGNELAHHLLGIEKTGYFEVDKLATLIGSTPAKSQHVAPASARRVRISHQQTVLAVSRRHRGRLPHPTRRLEIPLSEVEQIITTNHAHSTPADTSIQTAPDAADNEED